MLVTCESCWICCAPCAMSCMHEGRKERARHPDPCWTCCRLLEAVGNQDAIRHAMKLLEERMAVGVGDGEKMPAGWSVMRELCEERNWR